MAAGGRPVEAGRQDSRWRRATKIGDATAALLVVAALVFASCGSDDGTPAADGSPGGDCADVPRSSSSTYSAEADPLSGVECDAARAALALFGGADAGQCSEVASGRVLADCEELAGQGGRAVDHILSVTAPDESSGERTDYAVEVIFEADGSSLLAYYDADTDRIVDGSWD